VPEKRKNFFLVLAYYHHTIESPGTTEGMQPFVQWQDYDS